LAGERGQLGVVADSAISPAPGAGEV